MDLSDQSCLPLPKTSLGKSCCKPTCLYFGLALVTPDKHAVNKQMPTGDHRYGGSGAFHVIVGPVTSAAGILETVSTEK